MIVPRLRWRRASRKTSDVQRNEQRHEVIVATKFGIVRGNNRAFRGVNGRPECVRQSCDGSLRRLGVELTGEDLARRDEVMPKGTASGARYPEAMMPLANV